MVFAVQLLSLLLAYGVLHEAKGNCIRRDAHADYSKVVLPSKEELWLCADPTQVFPGFNRSIVSDCYGPGYLPEAMECSSTDVTDATAACTSDPTAPLNAEEIQLSSIPDYVRVYKCPDGMVFQSGKRTQRTQCILGNWTPVFDMCWEECSDSCRFPRDCSEVAKLGYISSDKYHVSPTGKNKVEVWCVLGEDPNLNGWTQIFIGSATAAVISFKDEAGTPGPIGDINHVDEFFIGIENLAALTWNPEYEFVLTKRPQEIRFHVLKQGAQIYLHATYDNFVINHADGFNILSTGDFHGNAGNALNGTVGVAFEPTSGTGFGWGARFQMNSASKEPIWKENVYLIVGDMRPTDFQRDCPTAIAFDDDWSTTTEVNITMERAEGTTIDYRCIGPMMREGPEDAPFEEKAVSGTITCVDKGGVLNWSYVPELPCSFSCPNSYVKRKDEAACLKFSNETAKHGTASATLKCSEDGASLAEDPAMVEEDWNTAVDGQPYYQSEFDSSSMTCFTRSKDVLDDNVVTPCHTESRFICQYPPVCPDKFYDHRGLCYIAYPGVKSVMEALLKCEEVGSALFYPENRESLYFLYDLLTKYTSPDMTKENRLLIGLNSRFANWSSGFEYELDRNLSAIVGEPTPDQPFRYATLQPYPTGGEITLTAIGEQVDPGTPIDHIVCQRHGPMGCWNEPPPPTANMTLADWTENKTGSKATYKCYQGYFMKDNISITEQEFTCWGQLGGWVASDNEFEVNNCTKLKVCTYDQLSCDNMTYGDITISDDFLTLNSTIQYTCPANKTMPGGQTEANSTCIYDVLSSPPYRFDPPHQGISCSVCVQNISVENATTTWKEGDEYTEGMEVTVTCEAGFLRRFKNGSESDLYTLSCGAVGWNIDPETIQCLPACYSSPVPGSNMTVNETSLLVGTKLVYECDEGLSIPGTFPDTANSADATCQEDRTWSITKGSLTINETDLFCAEFCADDPPSSPTADTSWDKKARAVGTTVHLTCPDGYFFPNLTTNISASCEEERLWTNLTEEEMLCRRYTDDPPVAPEDTVFNHTSPPYWEGTTLTFACREKYVSSTGYREGNTSTTFNGNEWVPLHPDFHCLPGCGEPVATDDATILDFNGTGLIGEVAFYLCPGGFGMNITEDSEDEGVFNLTSNCEEGGDWTLTEVPVCQMCAPPVPAPENAELILPKDGVFRYGELVTYECPGGFPNGATRMTSMCIEGTWTINKLALCSRKLDFADLYSQCNISSE